MTPEAVKLLPCPSALKTMHKPYVAYWDDKHETLVCPTAVVQCTCGFKGPERYGDDCQEQAIEAWNTRHATEPKEALNPPASPSEEAVDPVMKVSMENKRKEIFNDLTTPPPIVLDNKFILKTPNYQMPEPTGKTPLKLQLPPIAGGDWDIEALSAETHKIYCEAYQKRHGKPYWTNGDYSKLDEETKEYDRHFVRWAITRFALARDVVLKKRDCSCKELGWLDGCPGCAVSAVAIALEKAGIRIKWEE